ncbi:hypothetical protein ITX44_26660 [Streptomyces sp. KK5PA1]|uniref:Uncharacterized protein n=1 Tax=Actinacidiphila acididurans TaxID=2784346 RepID=A0ABS2TXK7_9ACTN|nr:hypothetical protein [Actinacidiphila acididurans]
MCRTGFAVAADGSYAACLAEASGSGGRWFAERWTLSGPEPYAVPLPGAQPEEVSAKVLPLSDGRVLLMRRLADRHDVVLLHPAGPGTAEVPVCSLPGTDVRLLPPSPAAGSAFALVPGPAGGTEIRQVHGPGGPVRVAAVAGRCTGGVWLDRTGRFLAVDRERDGRTKTVAVDLHTGEVTDLLRITEDSDDRLLLAEPDSGLLVLRSDATGTSRLGWGVLGSGAPVRFPDSLRPDGLLLTPVAASPGHGLALVALRAGAPGGAESLALWRPGAGRPNWRPAPAGWLGPTALWLPDTPLRLPFSLPDGSLALASYDAPSVCPPAPAGAPQSTAVRAPVTPVTRTAEVLPLQDAPLPRGDARA